MSSMPLIRQKYRDNKSRARLDARKSDIVLVLAGFALLLISVMFIHARHQQQADLPLLNIVAGIVAKLELTDLCLFTEARYTRHLSQTDLHSAFQDHPVALEHFPTGSLAGPPALLRRHHGRID